MEIEDERRDSQSSDSTSNFKVIADQAAEQNYAVNVYKGSGIMSNMLDQMEKDGEKARAQKLMQERIATATPAEPSAQAGESAI